MADGKELKPKSFRIDDETAENIEKIVNQLKQLATEITIVNYKEKVA